MKKNKDYLGYIILIIGLILIGFILFLVFNKANECINKGGILIQSRCVKKEVLVNDKD